MGRFSKVGFGVLPCPCRSASTNPCRLFQMILHVWHKTSQDHFIFISPVPTLKSCLGFFPWKTVIFSVLRAREYIICIYICKHMNTFIFVSTSMYLKSSHQYSNSNLKKKNFLDYSLLQQREGWFSLPLLNVLILPVSSDGTFSHLSHHRLPRVDVLSPPHTGRTQMASAPRRGSDRPHPATLAPSAPVLRSPPPTPTPTDTYTDSPCLKNVGLNHLGLMEEGKMDEKRSLPFNFKIPYMLETLTFYLWYMLQFCT